MSGSHSLDASSNTDHPGQCHHHRSVGTMGGRDHYDGESSSGASDGGMSTPSAPSRDSKSEKTIGALGNSWRREASLSTIGI